MSLSFRLLDTSSMFAAKFTICLLFSATALFGGEARARDKIDRSAPEAPFLIYSEETEGGNSKFYIPLSVNHLVQALSPHSWEVLNFQRPDLVKAVERHPPEFIFTNSDLAVMLERFRGYRPLLSFRNIVSSDAGKLSGSLIVVRKDSPLQRVGELDGKRIGRLHGSSMAGWKSAVGEVTSLGYDPGYFFKRVQSFQTDALLLSALKKGEIEAGILQGCHFERLPESERKGFRPIEPRSFSETACLSTSELYPAWTLLASSNVPPDITSKVSEDLKRVDFPKEMGDWVSAVPLREVYALLKRSGDDLIGIFEPESFWDLLYKWRYPFFFWRESLPRSSCMTAWWPEK